MTLPDRPVSEAATDEEIGLPDELRTIAEYACWDKFEERFISDPKRHPAWRAADALDAKDRDLAEAGCVRLQLCADLNHAAKMQVELEDRIESLTRARDEAIEALRCAQQQCETSIYNITQREHDESVVRSFQSIADFCARSVLAARGEGAKDGTR